MDSVLKTVARLCYAHIGTPRALTCSILLEHGEWTQLASLRLKPSDYLDAEAYRLDAQAYGLLRKFEGFPTDDPNALADRALETFLACERKNAAMNVLLRTVRANEPQNRFAHDYLDFLDVVRRYVKRVLGSAPDLDIRNGCFGPGAAVGLDGTLVCVPNKLASVTMTSGAWPWLSAVSSSAWGRSIRRTQKGCIDARVVEPRFCTVPKDATTDRPIIVGPSLNVVAQKAIGDAIRRRLRFKAGIDLDHGQVLHQALAESSSVDSSWATLDLSSASDSVCLEIVRAVLPPDWLALMEQVRYITVPLNGVTHVLHQFSSMGNGYTFELESLLFWAIAQAAQEFDLEERGIAHVYGDDIIVPDSATQVVSRRLEQCGFTLNQTKSFSGSSPFRESCGGDFFDGVDVSVVRIKEVPCGPCDYVELYNKLIARFPASILDPLRRAVPVQVRFSVPRGMEGGFWDGRTPIFKWNPLTQSYSLRTVNRTFEKKDLREWEPGVQMSSILYGLPQEFATRETGYKAGWTHLWGVLLP